jgi:hypothetical protein
MTEQYFPAQPSEQLPTTGDEQVDRALAPLANLPGELAEQVGSYVGAHRALGQRLSELDG